MFKVVPDQLKMGDGWARCGHCAEVFDATANLQTPVVVSDAPAPPPPPVAVIASAPAADVLLAQGIPADLDAPGERAYFAESGVAQVATFLAHGPSRHARDTGPDDTDASSDGEDESSEPSAGQSHTEPPADRVNADAPAAVMEDSSAPDIMPAMTEAAHAKPTDFSFVREAERKAFWRRPMVRWLLLLLCVVLLAVLGGQTAIQHRDEIAARVPALRPALEAMCQKLGCEVTARRHIESIVIDSSSFNKLRGDTYQLSLTLKNTAVTALAAPSIELTLTDAQDQAVLRRVLQPTDLGLGNVLPARGDANLSLPIGVSGEAGSARIAGYRLLAFYP